MSRPCLHLHGRAGPAIDHDVSDRRALLQRLVHDRLQLDLSAAAIARVLRQHGDAAGVVDAVGDGVGRKAAKDHRVDRADARTGQQRNRQLGTHAHVDGDAVAALDAQALQHVGKALDFVVQIAVGQPAHLARLALPQDGDLVLAGAQRVTVHTVVREIQLAAYEPLRVLRLPLGHAGPRSEPLQFPGGFRPELLRLLDARPVHRLILLEALDIGLCRKLRRRSKHPIFPQS